MNHKKFLKNYGNYALVTGASSGIGREFAKELAARGVVPILTARREERLNELAKEIKKKYFLVAPICVADLSKEKDITKIIDFCKKFDVGLLILNAGFGLLGKFEKLSLKQQLQMVELNCKAPLILSHGFFKTLCKRKHSGVIFLSSVVAHESSPLMSVYSAAKAFDRFLAHGLYQEWKSNGIDVLAVSPGPVQTEFFEVAVGSTKKEGVSANMIAKKALQTLGKKPELLPGLSAKLIAWARKPIPLKCSLAITSYFVKKKK